MPSLKDIAKVCGVSVATVSKALNGQKDISEATRRRIVATADKMGYMVNYAARTLKTNRSYNLGMLFMYEGHNGLGREYFSTVLDGFRTEAESHGYDITFLNNHISNQAMSYSRHCRNRGLDGVLIACVDFSNPQIRELAESGIPLVTVDHVFPGHTAILSDNVNGIDTLVRYAYQKGHRKIAYLHGEDTEVTRGRLACFHQACLELGLQIPPEYLIPCVYHDLDICGVATSKLLQLPDPPTCILFPDDFTFIGASHAFLEVGCNILNMNSLNKTISAMGYNGIRLSRVMRLTTYSQNAHVIGKTAAERLIRRIEDPSAFQPEQILVSGSLQEGVTVADLNE